MPGLARQPHVIVLGYCYDRDCPAAEEQLARYFPSVEWAESLVEAGAAVTVFLRFHRGSVIQRAGVTYRFCADRYGPVLRSWQVPTALHRGVYAAARKCAAQGVPVVVHQNGLIFPVQTALLRRALPRDCALVVQHHAERPWRRPADSLQRWGLRGVDGFLFATRELAAEWVRRSVIATEHKVLEVMECSTRFRRRARAAARAATGMTGRPVLLWTGNLTANKAPLTILAGFEQLLDHAPQARLYMAFRGGDLLDRVKARVAAGRRLRSAVVLLGDLPHAAIEARYNSADVFVQGSAREGSGVALLEALACGVVPVVTDIPAFRAITGRGEAGVLWPRGSADRFAQAVRDALAGPIEAQSREVAAFFERTWSYPVLGRRALAAYREVIARRAGT